MDFDHWLSNCTRLTVNTNCGSAATQSLLLKIATLKLIWEGSCFWPECKLVLMPQYLWVFFFLFQKNEADIFWLFKDMMRNMSTLYTLYIPKWIILGVCVLLCSVSQIWSSLDYMLPKPSKRQRRLLLRMTLRWPSSRMLMTENEMTVFEYHQHLWSPGEQQLTKHYDTMTLIKKSIQKSV